ncbi:hypothetical protein RSal33209_2553 [Renibacterium salmoninarum ATCC 33209]|uniref:Uncharacterized protein n=1 Tax=Renibacterium salmoninarum (strain ATCC 33209 / DSM 20767 / JCM 11484 / NBRC 15589 / NCIMB 2235) TaxID=288705 RepID=A9WRJ7_RENSM|nr:hypothetical protein [Renibacterium salmoninarum]ABY24279.1 hypothetical protein RSal33209_2553 [Renibacterium salmoninarum ATCC 33209]
MTRTLLAETSSNAKKKSRLFAVPAAAVAVVALGLLSAMPAQAAVTNPVNGSSVVSGSSVTVQGTVPTGAGFYAISSCNVAKTPGTACNGESGRATRLTAAASSYSNSVIIDGDFNNFDFTTRQPGVGSTTCLNTAKDNGGEQCAIVVSYYGKTPAGQYVPVGAPDVVNVYVD